MPRSGHTYDGNGNLVTSGGQSFTYDAWNHMTEAGGQNYSYDALGRKITITQDSPGTDPAKDFYFSDQWQVLEEREAGASVAKRQYVWSAVYVDAMVLRDQDSGTDGTLDERLYVQQDANFNVTALTGTSGTVVERYNYEPFGAATVLNADWSAHTGASDYGWEYLHQGGRQDASTGLTNFRNREYDASLGRWAQQDPMGYVDGLNLYQYEMSMPTGMLDPLGTWGLGSASSGFSGGGGSQAVAVEKPRGGGTMNAMAAGATTQPTTKPTTNPCPPYQGWDEDFGENPDWRDWLFPGSIYNGSDDPIWWVSNEGEWRPLPPKTGTPSGVDADGWAPRGWKPGDPIYKVPGTRYGGPGEDGKPINEPHDPNRKDVLSPPTEFGPTPPSYPPERWKRTVKSPPIPPDPCLPVGSGTRESFESGRR